MLLDEITAILKSLKLSEQGSSDLEHLLDSVWFLKNLLKDQFIETGEAATPDNSSLASPEPDTTRALYQDSSQTPVSAPTYSRTTDYEPTSIEKPIARQSDAGPTDIREGQSSLPLPVNSLLPNYLEFGKSLRGLRRLYPYSAKQEVDQEATATAFARTGLWLPQFHPVMQSRLELTLLVEDSSSMLIWYPLLIDFCNLLQTHSAFQQVTLWSLSVNGNPFDITLRQGLDLANSTKLPVSLGAINNPARAQVVLVVSDCVASYWRNATFLSRLKKLSQLHPLALLQMLPMHLWSRSGIGPALEVTLSATQRASLNSSLQLRDTYLNEAEIERGFTLPVLQLEPASLKVWANVLQARSGATILGLFFTSEQLESPPAKLPDATPTERLIAFHQTSSAKALEIAILLSAFNNFDYNTLEFLRELEGAELSHLAEVITAGFIVQDNLASLDPYNAGYRFESQAQVVLFSVFNTNHARKLLKAIFDKIEEDRGRERAEAILNSTLNSALVISLVDYNLQAAQKIYSKYQSATSSEPGWITSDYAKKVLASFDAPHPELLNLLLIQTDLNQLSSSLEGAEYWREALATYSLIILNDLTGTGKTFLTRYLFERLTDKWPGPANQWLFPVYIELSSWRAGQPLLEYFQQHIRPHSVTLAASLPALSSQRVLLLLDGYDANTHEGLLDELRFLALPCLLIVHSKLDFKEVGWKAVQVRGITQQQISETLQPYFPNEPEIANDLASLLCEATSQESVSPVIFKFVLDRLELSQNRAGENGWSLIRQALLAWEAWLSEANKSEKLNLSKLKPGLANLAEKASARHFASTGPVPNWLDIPADFLNSFTTDNVGVPFQEPELWYFLEQGGILIKQGDKFRFTNWLIQAFYCSYKLIQQDLTADQLNEFTRTSEYRLSWALLSGTEVVARLLDWLDPAYVRRCLDSVWVLGVMREVGAIEPFLALIKEFCNIGRVGEAYDVADALLEIAASPQALDSLLNALYFNTDGNIIYWVVEALGQSGSPRAIAAIQQLSSEVRATPNMFGSINRAAQRALDKLRARAGRTGSFNNDLP